MNILSSILTELKQLELLSEAVVDCKNDVVRAERELQRKEALLKRQQQQLEHKKNSMTYFLCCGDNKNSLCELLQEVWKRRLSPERAQQRTRLEQLAVLPMLLPMTAHQAKSTYGSWMKKVGAAVIVLHDTLTTGTEMIRIGNRLIDKGDTLVYFSVVTGKNETHTMFLGYVSTKNCVCIGHVRDGLATALPLHDLLGSIAFLTSIARNSILLGTSYVLYKELTTS